MPQLNPEYFASQIFWLFVTFAILYALLSNLVLPRIGKVLDDRAGRIKGDLDKADGLRAQVEQARQGYEAALNDARQKAQAITAASRADGSAQAERRKADLARALAAETAAAEAGIAKAKAEALTGLRDVSVEATQAILHKVGGLTVAADKVQAAVEAELGAAK